MVEGGEDQPPAETQPTQQPDRGGGMSSIDAGWGGGTASFDDVIDNVKAVFETMQGDILNAWLAIAAVLFVLESVDVVVYTFMDLVGLLGGFMGLLMFPLGILISIGYFAATAAQMSLYGPLREAFFQGNSPDGVMGALRAGTSRFWPVLGALAGITFVIPLACVIPGLVLAYFGIMGPYLVATRPIGVVDGFKESYELAKRYWRVLVVTIGALFAAGIVLGCCAGGGGFIGGFAPSPLGYIFSQYATWFGAMLFQFGLFVVWGGVFVTIDAEESGESL